jgi:hypothetical protein
MSTLTEIEAAADQLPPEQVRELVVYLTGKLQRRNAGKQTESSQRVRRGFAVSRGRVPFGAAEVARIEAGE